MHPKTRKQHKKQYKSRKRTNPRPFTLQINDKGPSARAPTIHRKPIDFNPIVLFKTGVHPIITKSLLDGILHIRKLEYDSLYSPTLKYPLLVQERITKNTGHTRPGEPYIDRAQIIDPDRKDPDVSIEVQYTVADYHNMMKYGLSAGHNTPAGNHKTTRPIWDDTFLMTNMTPQEMTFNSGVWVLLESWTKSLGTHPKLANVHCFTGVIPDTEAVTTTEGVTVNIPTHWYKIITATSATNPRTLFTMAIMMPNTHTVIDPPNIDYYTFGQYVVPLMKLDHLNFLKIMEAYLIYRPGYHRLQNLKYEIALKYRLSPVIQTQMEKANWYGKLIYAPTLPELEAVWTAIQDLKTKFKDLQYHEEYYKYTKSRLTDMA